MKVLALLNRDGGSLKRADLTVLSTRICDEFQVQGHEIEVQQHGGDEIVEAINEAAERSDLDVLMVGGGDGTVSAAASRLAGKTMALAILPAGTMNLFTRTLQIPQDLEEAIGVLASGDVVSVDYATANGEPFTHQFAIGLHARMVRMRETISYGSRIGKIVASSRAVFMALRKLPAVDVEIEIDGKPETVRTPAIAISNNMYGPGHIPYADDPSGGVLGVYICTERRAKAVYRLTFDIMMGTWRNNPNLLVKSAKRVRLVYSGKHHKHRAVRDGELVELPKEMIVEIHPGGLNVLAPRDAQYHSSGDGVRSDEPATGKASSPRL